MMSNEKDMMRRFGVVAAIAVVLQFSVVGAIGYGLYRLGAAVVGYLERN